MTHEKLDNLVKIGKLKLEDVSESEIKGLLQSGIARLETEKALLARAFSFG